MNKKDVKYVNDLHNRVHGVPGMAGSLDCLHVHWHMCPSAHRGQFQGKEKKPTIILEAVADYNLRIWHANFGFPGTYNDINVWEKSTLRNCLLGGYWKANKLDFDFTINNHYFENVYFLVDGIYPKLNRFVQAIVNPVTAAESEFTIWQEYARKDVERAFGVLRKKYMSSYVYFE